MWPVFYHKGWKESSISKFLFAFLLSWLFFYSKKGQQQQSSAYHLGSGLRKPFREKVVILHSNNNEWTKRNVFIQPIHSNWCFYSPANGSKYKTYAHVRHFLTRRIYRNVFETKQKKQKKKSSIFLYRICCIWMNSNQRNTYKEKTGWQLFHVPYHKF